jgi:hypothetical protein
VLDARSRLICRKDGNLHSRAAGLLAGHTHASEGQRKSACLTARVDGTCQQVPSIGSRDITIMLHVYESVRHAEALSADT